MSKKEARGPLLCVVTGMEHSGTTFLSKLLTAHPRVNAAFECGILIGDSPADIPGLRPWSEWFLAPIEEGHWGLSEAQVAEVAAAKDWNGAYAKIIEHCPLFREGEDLIVDKSPRYLQDLSRILAKAPGIPCLVLEKDALLMFHSYKRRGFEVKRFVDYFNRCQRSLAEAEKRFSVTRISQERLSEDQAGVFRELCDQLGLAYDERYITRGWCKRNMYGISFIWLFKKPYDYRAAVDKARGEITAQEIAVLKSRLLRPSSESRMFAALDE